MKAIYSQKAPEPIGCYSQAVLAGDWIFISGQIGMDPQTHALIGPGFSEQLRQVFTNLEAVIQEAGASFEKIAKLTIYLQDLNHFSEVNNMMSNYFKSPFPARATVEVSKLPKDALVEIDAIVYMG